MKKHIAVFLPSLSGGGAERVMVTLVNGFASRGIQVDLVLAKAEGPYLKNVVSGVRIVDLNASRILFSLPRLIRYLRNERPIAMLSGLSHANVIALMAKRLSWVNTRYIVSEHNTVSLSLPDRKSRFGRLIPRLVRWTYPWADGVVAVSEGVANDLAATMSFMRERMDVIYNPIDANTIQQLTNQPLEHPWFLHGEPPVIIGVGRLVKAKNFAVLIKAFAQVRKTQPAHLVILGDGELRSDLEALTVELDLSEEVAMPGFVENPYSWMRNSAVFVLSSAWEGFGNVLVEAMACGIPVVSTDCPNGPAEILEDGLWGRLVPMDDKDALANAILQTLSEPKHPDVVLRASDFSVEKALDEYLKVLEGNA